MAVMVFSMDETVNKVLVCAGVPEKGDKCKQLKVLEWLVAALKPLKGKGGGGKGGLAQGQVSNVHIATNPTVHRNTCIELFSYFICLLCRQLVVHFNFFGCDFREPICHM